MFLKKQTKPVRNSFNKKFKNKIISIYIQNVSCQIKIIVKENGVQILDTIIYINYVVQVDSIHSLLVRSSITTKREI